MNYVLAGYGVSVGAIAAYSAWLLWRGRKLTGRR